MKVFSSLNRVFLRAEKSLFVRIAVMERAYILEPEAIQARRIRACYRNRDGIFIIAEDVNGNVGTMSKH